MKLELPALQFAYNALEPYMDAETVEVHYDKHHRGYLTKLLGVLETYPELMDFGIEYLLKNLDSLEVNDSDRTKIKNFGGGFYNHILFWEAINPKNEKNNELVSDIIKNFGDVEKFKEKFNQLAKTHFGSGWVWLVKNGEGKLEIYSLPNQDCPLTLGHIPVLALDVWEHAYYLKYKNKRDEFVDVWWNLVKLI